MNDISQRVKELIGEVPMEYDSPSLSAAIDRLTLVCNLLNQRTDALETALAKTGYIHDCEHIKRD